MPFALRHNAPRTRRWQDVFPDERTAHRAGMWTRALLNGNADDLRWCRDQGIEMRAGNEGGFSAGGALVPIEMANAVISLREEYGIARQLCDVVPMGRQALDQPRREGGLTAHFVDEGVAVPESDPTWSGVGLTTKTLSTLTRVSVELAEDSPLIAAARFADEVAEAFGAKEDDCWLNGDGTSTYGGIVGIRTKLIDGMHTVGAIDAQSGHDTFAEIDADDLNKLLQTLPKYAHRRASWLISQQGKALLFDALAAATGGNTIMSIGERPRPTYLGYPVEVSTDMPNEITDLSDQVMVLFGDFAKASMFGDRSGMALYVLRERYAATGQIGILARERIDIVNHGLGDTTTAGAVVGLVGE